MGGAPASVVRSRPNLGSLLATASRLRSRKLAAILFMINPLQKGGSVRLRRRVHGPGRWEFRYWSTGNTGERKLKSLVIGSTAEYANENAVRAKAAELLAVSEVPPAEIATFL